MLQKDVAKLKQVLKQYRKDRRFQKQFASLMPINPPTQSIAQKFANRFPKLTYLAESTTGQNSFSYVINSFNTNLTFKSETEPELSKQLEKEDEQIWRKYGNERKNLPIPESNREIQLINQCFKQFLTKVPAADACDRLHEIYIEKGGYKTYQQFKQKIESDVLYLVRRQKQKQRK